MKKTEKKRRKAWLWVLLIVLLVLTAAAFGLYRWQENNIEAVKNYTQYTQEELEVKLQENTQQVQEMLDQALEAAREVDAKEQEAPVEVQPAEVPAEQTSTQQPSVQQQPPAEKKPTYEELLKAIIDKIYALRSEYVGALEGLEDEGIAAYKAIPAEKRKGKYLVEFASTYISKASKLESDCDKKMDGLVAELEALQKQYGQSDELVQQVIDTYAKEKSLKKAWYMSQLEKRGMV